MSEKHCTNCRYDNADCMKDPCKSCLFLNKWEPAYTLADLEQARKQGAEDERGRCIEAVIDATHGGALRSAVDAIRALGPVGETREEAERRVRRRTVKLVCDRAEHLNDQDGRPVIYNISAVKLDAIAEGK